MDYSTRAHDYAAHTAQNLYNAHYERPGILSLLPDDLSHAHALDAGCGPGHHSIELARRGALVTAIDQSADMVAMTRERLGSQHTAFQADLSVPLETLEENAFDLILSSLTLHYIRDLSVPFGEFARIARPGARLVFSMHHPCTTIQYFPRDNYFQTTHIDDTWTVEGEPFHVSYWARPLSVIFQALAKAGWPCFQIHEPKPLKPFDPETTRNLWRRPHFLFVSAQRGV